MPGGSNGILLLVLSGKAPYIGPRGTSLLWVWLLVVNLHLASFLGDGGLHELGHDADHTPGASGQLDRADRGGERPRSYGSAESVACWCLCGGRELCAFPGGSAVTKVLLLLKC